MAEVDHGSGHDHRLRYAALFLDVDNTLLWVLELTFEESVSP